MVAGGLGATWKTTKDLGARHLWPVGKTGVGGVDGKKIRGVAGRVDVDEADGNNLFLL